MLKQPYRNCVFTILLVQTLQVIFCHGFSSWAPFSEQMDMRPMGRVVYKELGQVHYHGMIMIYKGDGLADWAEPITLLQSTNQSPNSAFSTSTYEFHQSRMI